jgi:L-threonylcarbamoyladenylate synthase
MSSKIEILHIDSALPSQESLNSLVGCLNRGGVALVPTDTVYGLICEIDNPRAVARIYEIKKREQKKPLPVFVNGYQQAASLADLLPVGTKELCDTYWPGALTLVVPCAKKEYVEVTRNTGKIGLRMPRSLLIEKIIDLTGKPLASTSANFSHKPPCKDIKSLPLDFFQEIDFILDGGPIGSGVPSTVIDLSSPVPQLLREGDIHWEAIQRILQSKSR